MLNGRKLPDMLFGALFGITIFVLGFSVALSLYPPEKNQTAQGAQQSSNWTRGDERIADYTLVLDWLNFFLVVSTIGLWFQTRRSARIAEQALIGVERPRILSFTPDFGLRNDKMTAQIGLLNFGRDPGLLVKITVKFFTDDELPAIPDFSGGETHEPDMWLLPVSNYDQPMQARAGFVFEGDKTAKLFAIRVSYEWDFGKHEHAFATTIVIRAPGSTEFSKSVGGKAYNYDK
jgi:hypothetical protein